MKRINKIFFLIGILSLLASCVTEKRRGELSALGKLYHNTTARYNGYFNANELLEASILSLKEQHRDNYKEILPVYEYVDVDNPQGVAGDLDRAIEKVSVVVNLHRQSNWTDDCYLLMGKAQYLKQDYEAAEETLRYMVKEFSPEKMAARNPSKKKGEKGEGSTVEDNSNKTLRELVESGEVEASELSEREQRRLKRQEEKARKRYNKQLKKQRKREQKNRKKRRKKRKKDNNTTPNQEEQAQAVAEENQEAPPAPAPVAEKENEEAAEEPVQQEIGMVSIADDDEPAAEAVEGEPDDYFLQHRPAYQEGVLWLARTLVKRAKYDQAMRLVLQLEGSGKTFDDIRQELAVVKAHYFLEQEENNQALQPLEDAIAAANNRQDRARYAFIIAQIHQRAGREGEAYAAFQRALNYGPSYSMEFNGRLFLVENGWKNGTIASEDAKNRLEKMRKDIKNEEFQDQIYYTLAEIELESGNRTQGIEYLRKSLAYNRQNPLQKGESYLRLANLYLADEDFVRAQKYFDSTLTVLPQADERYAEVEKWRDNLTEIAQSLETIYYQDSLLRIASLSEEEQRELAYEIKKEQDEKRLQEIANNAGNNSVSDGKNPAAARAALTSQRGVAGRNESSFFAYDDRAVKRGKRDFTRKWGNRTLEDNWRRSSKRSSGEFALAEDDLQTPADVLPEDAIEQILEEVPKTDSELLAARLKVQEAMFKLGTLYRDRLGNNRKAIEVLEAFNRRFDRSNYQIDAWYYLYLAYSDLNESQKAQQYADLIIQKYPGTPYAQVLQNPDYAAQMAAEQNKLGRYYDETYADFENGNYREAYQKSMEAPRIFGSQNAMQSKFALLSAMAIGNIQGKEAYINSLKDLIARYPETAEQKRAREILRLLGVSGASLPGAAQEESTQYKVTDDQLHYILILFNEDISLNESKVAVSNYNLEYHKLDKLRISNIYLGTDAETRLPILVVRRFKDKAAAMAYYEGTQKNKSDFIDQSVDYEVFAVSQNNYREILRSKSLDGYRNFFNQNYLQ